MKKQTKQVETKGLSIFYQLLIGFLSIVALVSISLTVVYYFFSKKTIEHHVIEDISKDFSVIKYDSHHRFNEMLIRNLQVLAANPVVNEFLMSSELNAEINARSVERLFLQSTRHMKNILSISFIDYAGIEKIRVSKRGRSKTYRNFNNDKLFRQIESSPPASILIKPPYTNKEGNHLFSIGIHKTDPDIGEFSGAIILEYSLDNFFAYLEQIKIFGANPIWVFSPDGQILQQPGNVKVSHDPRPHLSKELQHATQTITSKDGLIVYEDLTIGTSLPLMRVCISVPQALLLKDINEVLRFLFIVSICSLLAAVIITFFVSRYLSKPIVELASTVTTFSKSNPSPVDIKASGEVKMLVDSFNEMVLDLEQTTVSRDYVDNIIKNMIDTLIVVSPEGTIQTVNSAVCNLLGYDEAELLEEPLKKIIGKESFKKTGLDRLIQIETVQDLEITYLSKENKEIPVIFSSSIMRDSDDKKRGTICLAQDITERKLAEKEKKQLENQLRQAHKMEAIGTLAGGIAHDFNNILTAIIGYTELAIAELPEESRIKADLDIVIQSGKRAKNLVNQILAFSRQHSQELIPIEISPTIKETTKMLRSTIPSTVEIHENISQEKMIIKADPTKIHQIVVNLCANAVQAMNEKGVLEIGLNKVSHRPKNDEVSDEKLAFEDYAHLLISDNGTGMDEATIEHIFDPFFTTKDIGKGTGLGLSVVHGIVESFGGEITVESEVGKGTTFHIFLPLVDEKIAIQNESIGDLPMGNESILLVDDENVIVTMGKRILERLGYNITICTSSIEALDEFRAQPDKFDLVITDQTMPKMTGKELAKELLLIRADIPIIMCSGYGNIISEEEAKSIGIRDYIKKPFIKKNLAETVRDVLDE